MLQKIIKVGNSYAITIPKNVANALQVSDGTLLHAYPDVKTRKIILDFDQQQPQATDIVNEEVYTVAKDLLSRYLPAFKALAKR